MDRWGLAEVVCPGLYAGRIAERVKIGYSFNLPARVSHFHFEELIGLLPLSFRRYPLEDDRCYGYRVRDELRERERRLHEALVAIDPGKRIRRLARPNTNEWFSFDDAVVRVLFAHGVIVARARVSGRPLGLNRPPITQ